MKARTANPTDTSPVPWSKVDEYIVTYPTGTAPARIQLVGPDGNFGTELVFVRDDSSLPNDTPDQGHYRLNELADVLDLLRNEQPIYYVFNGPTPDHTNGLQTGGKVGTKRAQHA